MNVFPTLPQHWVLTRLDRVATVHARIGWKALTAAEYVDDGYVFLSTPNIKTDKIDFLQVNYVTEFRYRESPDLMLRVGDVLLVKDGNTLGITNLIVEMPRPATVNGSIAVLRPRGVEPRFLRYVLASSPLQGHIQAVRDGMGVPHLFQRDINRFPIPLPPQDEQRRIADFLDEQVGLLDRAIRLRQQQMTLMGERFGAQLNWHYAPGEERTHTPLRKLLLQRPSYGVLVPKHVDEGVPFIRVADLNALRQGRPPVAFIPPEQSVEYRRTVVRPGDVLTSVVGTLGTAAIVPTMARGANIARAVCLLRPNQAVSAWYLLGWLSTPEFLSLAEGATGSGTAQATLNMSDLSKFAVWLPSNGDLDHVAKDVQRIFEQREECEFRLQRGLDLLHERRQALVTAAVTGRLDVTTARVVA